MRKIVTFGFAENFIERVAEHIEREYIAGQKDLRRIAVVFGGKRPALFLKRELARRTKGAYFSPAFFSFDEFVDHILTNDGSGGSINEIDACYLLYSLARTSMPGLIGPRKGFKEFLPWAREIFSFIEQLDLEDIAGQRLADIQKNAQIGYEVPDTINQLLAHIVSLRAAYHRQLGESGSGSRGMRYLRASRVCRARDLDEFDVIFFCNLFYLHRTEEKIIKEFYDADKAVLFFQRDDRHWSIFERLEKTFGAPLEAEHPLPKPNRLSVYAGFDTHSQVSICRQVLSGIAARSDTVVVLPRSDMAIPLLSDIGGMEEAINVSVGYPLKRSSFYTLLELIAQAQKTKRNGEYYARDYMRLMNHPLVKNLRCAGHDPSVTRILVHKIQELLRGMQDSAIGGSLFIDLRQIEDTKDVYEVSLDTLRRVSLEVSAQELKRILCRLHHVMFGLWESIDDFARFCESLQTAVLVFSQDSPLNKYPVNTLIAESILAVCDQLKRASFVSERFSLADIFQIFLKQLDREMVSFSGSALEGLQVLGFMETRALNFKHVIVLDANEQVLPQLSIYEPLIPRQVMIQLGLNRLEKEDEIQRYQFFRLLGGAEDVHIIYDASQEKEKSRFLEELIWERQKQAQRIDCVETASASFAVTIQPQRRSAQKTEAVIEFLKDKVYSASSLTTYLRCPLSFYFRYVLGLKEQEDLLEEPEAADVGTFLHGFLEEAFAGFRGKSPLIDEPFRKSFMGLFERRFELVFGRRMKSDAFLLRQVMRVRLEAFLEHEARRQVKELVCLEQKGDRVIDIASGPVKCTYRVDRIDRLFDGSLLIIDYKSGGSDIKPINLARIREQAGGRRALKHTLKSFQLPLYYYCLGKTHDTLPVNACLYSLKDGRMDFFLKADELGSRGRIFADIESMLESLIAELWDPGARFEADDDDPRYCRFCPFAQLCR